MQDNENEVFDLFEIVEPIRDISSELKNPMHNASLFSSSKCNDHANSDEIQERVSVERKDKHIIVQTERRLMTLNIENKWGHQDSSINITTTQVEDLTYVVISGDSYNNSSEQNRFIFKNTELANNFKKDLTSAITDKEFRKSDHLIIPYENEKVEVKVNSHKPAKDWLVFVAYGLTVCALFLVASIAVFTGWKLVQGWFN